MQVSLSSSVSNTTLANALATLLHQNQQQAAPMVPPLMPHQAWSTCLTAPALPFDQAIAFSIPRQPMPGKLQQAVELKANYSSALSFHPFPANSLGNPSPRTVPASPNNVVFESQLKSIADEIAKLQALTSSATHSVANQSQHAAFHPSAPRHPATSPAAAGFPYSTSPSSRKEALSPAPAPSPPSSASRVPSSEHEERGRCKSARKIFPRRKVGEVQRNTHNPVVLNEYVLAEYFDMPLLEASKKLGICQTTLKKTCRRFGIRKWPYKTRRLESPPYIHRRGD